MWRLCDVNVGVIREKKRPGRRQKELNEFESFARKGTVLGDFYSLLGTSLKRCQTREYRTRTKWQQTSIFGLFFRKRQEEAAGVKEDDDDEVDNGGAWNPFVPIDVSNSVIQRTNNTMPVNLSFLPIRNTYSLLNKKQEKTEKH